MDLYEALYTTRAMRRLKPDPIPYGARPYHGRAEGSGLWCVFRAWSGNSVKEVE